MPRGAARPAWGLGTAAHPEPIWADSAAASEPECLGAAAPRDGRQAVRQGAGSARTPEEGCETERVAKQEPFQPMGAAIVLGRQPPGAVHRREDAEWTGPSAADRADSAAAWADEGWWAHQGWQTGAERQGTPETGKRLPTDAGFPAARARADPGRAAASWHHREWRDGPRLRFGPAAAVQADGGAEVFREADAPWVARTARPGRVAVHRAR